MIEKKRTKGGLLLMWIREMAKKLNVTPRTIRFYEEKGLIQLKRHPDNDYRIFSEKEAWQLQTILTLREVGMTIPQIREALSCLEKGEGRELFTYMELQRAVLFTEWVRIHQAIETLDRMMEEYNPDQPTNWEKLWELARQSRRMHALREKWKDRFQFDQWAKEYDQIIHASKKTLSLYSHYDEGLHYLVEKVAPQQGEMGLDIGIGTGNGANGFAKRGIPMHGVDQSKEMLAICRQKYPMIETRLGNFLAIPYPDAQFDFIITCYAFHFLTDEEKVLAIREMKRVLQPNGCIAILDFFFADEISRKTFSERWNKEGNDWLRPGSERCWGVWPKVREMFRQEGFRAEIETVHDPLQLVMARPK